MSAPERRYRRVADGVNAPPVRTRWAGRTEGPFPEVAEVLGVETDMILSALEMGGIVAVVLAPDRETSDDPDALRGVALRRDAEGILRQVGPIHAVPEISEALKGLSE